MVEAAPAPALMPTRPGNCPACPVARNTGLGRHAHGVLPLLGKARVIDDPVAFHIRTQHRRQDPGADFLQYGGIRPVRFGHEMMQPLVPCLDRMWIDARRQRLHAFTWPVAASGHGNIPALLRVGPRARRQSTGAQGRFRNASPSFAVRLMPNFEDANNALILVAQSD